MDYKNLVSLLKRTLFLLIFCAIAFVITINIYKFINFAIKVDNVISRLNNDEKLETIDDPFLKYDDFDNTNYNIDVAHRAVDIGYVDKIDIVSGDDWQKGIDILIIGADKEDFYVKKSRADVIIFLRITESGKIMSISIPRDSLVVMEDYRGRESLDKIAHAMYWGGVPYLKKCVEKLMRTKIDRLLIVDNFKSFEAFLSVLGGVNIDKNLEGKLGIQWIRNRNFKFGDIERCKRQQLFLEKSFVKLWNITKNGNIIYSSFMYDAFKNIVETDIDKKDFLKILYKLKANNFNPKNDFYTSVLAGNFSTYQSKLVGKKLTSWELDKDNLDKIGKLFYSEEYISECFLNEDVKFLSFLEMDMKTLFDKLKKTFNISIGMKNDIVMTE